MTTTYYVEYLSYACDDGIAESNRVAFADSGDALDCWCQLTDDGTLDGVRIWAERTEHPVIGSDEMPF